MCLALIAHDAHPAYAVVIAANRDEHHARTAAQAAWWNEGWIAGRDLLAGGTWLAVTPSGRFAFVTNVREPGRRDINAPSRGALVTRVVANAQPPAVSVAGVVATTAHYNGYNLIAGDLLSACWGSNRSAGVRDLGPGIHGISNAAMDAPWPKVLRSKAALGAWCATSTSNVDALFALLGDRSIAPDAQLPATGVSLEWERRLSAAFIVGEEVGYGTRCSTVVLLGRDGDARFVERTFDPAGNPTGEVDLRFALTAALPAVLPAAQ
jgi:uncharacterized protein with NRDE domain